MGASAEKIETWGGRLVWADNCPHDGTYTRLSVNDPLHPGAAYDMLLDHAGVRALIGQLYDAIGSEHAEECRELVRLRAEYEAARRAMWDEGDRANALYQQKKRLRSALSDCGLPEGIIDRIQAGGDE